MKDHVLSLRVTADERDRLAALAAARGLTISDLIRSLVERETTPPVATETKSAPVDLVIGDVPASGSAFFWERPGGDGVTIDRRTLTVSAR